MEVEKRELPRGGATIGRKRVPLGLWSNMKLHRCTTRLGRKWPLGDCMFIGNSRCCQMLRNVGSSEWPEWAQLAEHPVLSNVASERLCCVKRTILAVG